MPCYEHVLRMVLPKNRKDVRIERIVVLVTRSEKKELDERAITRRVDRATVVRDALFPVRGDSGPAIKRGA